MKTYYLVDFENVKSEGLIGCEKLTETDYIYLFYTENAKNISLDIIDNLANLNFFKFKVPVRKQSTDMHLVSYLGYLIGNNKECKCEYNIISKDTDYDNIIAFWQEIYKIPIFRSENVAKKRNEDSPNPKNMETIELTQEIQKILSKSDYSNQTIDKTNKIVIKHYGEENLLTVVHNDLFKELENYKDIYSLIKPTLGKYSNVQKKPAVQSEKSLLNNEIQSLLSKANVPNEIIGYITSVIMKNFGKEKAKFQTYHDIISKYGQAKGLEIYNIIRKHI